MKETKTKKQTIPAEVHTDCHTAQARFDAEPWFNQASDQAILALAECGWGGDYPADEVAEFFSDTKRNKEVEDVFHTLRILRRKEDIGFECHVEEEPAMAWLRQNRPHMVTMINTAWTEAGGAGTATQTIPA
jgi:hypothetical protein